MTDSTEVVRVSTEVVGVSTEVVGASTEVVVFEGQVLTEEWPPENAVMFLLWLQRKLADVHSCYRNDVRIELGHEWRRGSFIRLSYPRPTPNAAKTIPQMCRSRAA